VKQDPSGSQAQEVRAR